jgi:hypothetical protein
MPSIREAYAPVSMTLEDAAFGGTFEDLQALARKSPQLITALVTIANKAEAQLPTIIRIVDRAGAELPRVLKIIDKAGAQLPRVVQIIETAEPYYPLILRILQDPQFPEVVKRVEKVMALSKGKPKKKGGGLADFGVASELGPVVKGLDAYIWMREHPVVVWGGAIGVVLGIFGLGFGVGRWTKKGR